MAVDRPSSPAPTTMTSKWSPAPPGGPGSAGPGLACASATSGSRAWCARAARRPDPVSQHPDARHFEFHRVAWDKPAAVVVFKDAPGTYRPGAEDLSRPERSEEHTSELQSLR